MSNETENLLTEFAVRRGLTGFQPDSVGRYTILLDDWAVRVFQAGRMLYLEASITALPPEPSQDTDPLTTILAFTLANLAAQQEILTLLKPDSDNQSERETLGLYRQLSLVALDLNQFEQALESFVNRLEQWRNYFQQTPRSPQFAMPMHILFP